MGMDKRIVQLIVVLSLIMFLFSLTSCSESNENSPSFQKFEFAKKIESFDVNDEGMFILLVGNCVNVYNEEGDFLKCIEFEKSGSTYAFFTNEGSLALYHYRSDKLYLLDHETDQFYEAENVLIDLAELEDSTVKKGVLEFVHNEEGTFHITIPTLFDFLIGNSSVKISKTSEDNEILIFDDDGKIYCDYYVSLIAFLTSFIMLSVFVAFLAVKFNKNNRRQQTKEKTDDAGDGGLVSGTGEII